MSCETCDHYLRSLWAGCDYCAYGYDYYGYCDSYDEIEDDDKLIARKKKTRRLRMAGRQGQNTQYGIKFIRVEHSDKTEILLRLGDVESIKTYSYTTKNDGKETTAWGVQVKLMGEDEPYDICGYEKAVNILEWVIDKMVGI